MGMGTRCVAIATTLTPAMAAYAAGGAVPTAGNFFLAGGALLAGLLAHRGLARLAASGVRRWHRTRVRQALRAHSDRLLDDTILPGAYGGLVRVDHALLTSSGVVCVRRVHGGGTVFGDDRTPQWTVVKGGTRQRFLNPVIQNEGRRRALEKALPGIPVVSLVIFDDGTSFSADPPTDCVRLGDTDRWLRQFQFGPSQVSDPQAAWQALQTLAVSDDAMRADFAAQVGFG